MTAQTTTPEPAAAPTPGRGIEYLQIRFKPAGGSGPVTRWVRRAPSASARRRVYWRVDDEGSRLDELIICGVRDVEERPARMNLHYGRLELVPTGGR